MKKILLIYLITLSSWSWQNKTLDFDSRITIIHSKVVDLTDVFALHHVKEFNDIYTNPLEYKTLVIEYLKQPVIFEKKLIAICAMTKLPLDSYMNLVDSCHSLYSKNLITQDLLERCTFNEFDNTNKITKSYKNPVVQKSLRQILTDKTLSNVFKKMIKETLNGKSAHELEKAGF